MSCSRNILAEWDTMKESGRNTKSGHPPFCGQKKNISVMREGFLFFWGGGPSPLVEIQLVIENFIFLGFFIFLHESSGFLQRLSHKF